MKCARPWPAKRLWQRTSSSSTVTKSKFPKACERLEKDEEVLF